MRSTYIILTIIFFVIVLAHQITSCKKKDLLEGLTPLTPQLPAAFGTPAWHFSPDNPLSEEGFALGKRLFYDGRLAADNFTSCASCHQQIAAFGTYDHDRSHGVFNSHTLRNAPVLFNLMWQKKFHWDGAFNSLTEEAIHPITGVTEMGESFGNIIRKLNRDASYRKQFAQVFKAAVITPEQILKALAQFTGSFVSANSKYDAVKNGGASFTSDEQAGYQLFLTHCNSCHTEPLFTDYSFRNIGLPVDPNLNDYGLMRITGKKSDSLKFKVPTLRNVMLSNNYMHDGRFNTVGQCLQHYNINIQAGPTLDSLLLNRIPLTIAQQTSLYNFLRTLTDSSFIKNPRYAAP